MVSRPCPRPKSSAQPIGHGHEMNGPNFTAKWLEVSPKDSKSLGGPFLMEVFENLGLSGHTSGTYRGHWSAGGSRLESLCPATGKPLGAVHSSTTEEYSETVAVARETFARWRLVPAPRRGEARARRGSC